MKYRSKILGTTYMDFASANDNNIVMSPVWDGFSFAGYRVVKANWKLPDLFETWGV